MRMVWIFLCLLVVVDIFLFFFDYLVDALAMSVVFRQYRWLVQGVIIMLTVKCDCLREFILVNQIY